MFVPWPLFRSSLLIVFALGLGAILVTAVPTVPTVRAMPEQMHRDHSGEEQHPNPVL